MQCQRYAKSKSFVTAGNTELRAATWYQPPYADFDV